MSITTVQQAFEEYEKKARVPANQVERARDVHPEVRDAIKADLGELWKRDFLSGSYRRKVQTAPRLKDVDIIFVLNDADGTFEASAEVALERLRSAAKSCELLDRGTRMGIRAVKLPIKDEEFTVDAVAALEDEFGNIRLARFDKANGYDDWTPADPEGQLTAHWDKNSQMGSVFIPAARIIKPWNERTKWKTKHCLPSYLVQSMLFHSMTADVDYADAMLVFFRAAQQHLSIDTPSVLCPGSYINYVDDRFDDERRKAALTKVEEALQTAEDAAAESDPRKAMDLWADIFGPAFPCPSGDATALSAALKAGTARAVGAGISATAPSGTRYPKTRPWRKA